MSGEDRVLPQKETVNIETEFLSASNPNPLIVVTTDGCLASPWLADVSDRPIMVPRNWQFTLNKLVQAVSLPAICVSPFARAYVRLAATMCSISSL